MIESPRISVVIPTMNRGDVLATTLRALARQTLAPATFDVIVVDDGSSDGTDVMVQRAIGAVPYALRYVRHENRGPGYTQNRGIALADAELVLLLADDMWAVPELLERHIAAHKRHAGVNVAVLGRMQQSTALPPTHLHRHWDPFACDELEGKDELTPLHFWACNLSFSRTFLQRHGMFLERRGAANEDMELGFRLSAHGLRVFYEPAAVTYHYHPETIQSICRRAYEQGRNFDALNEVPRSMLLPFSGMFTLEAGLGYAARVLPRALLRACLFSPAMVKSVWIPLVLRAERDPTVRPLIKRWTYRGIFGCFCRKGMHDARQELTRAAH